MRRLVAGALFETENTYKVLEGRLAALRDPAFMAARAQGRGRPEGPARHRSEARRRRSAIPGPRSRRAQQAYALPVRGLARAGGRRRRRLGPLPLRPRAGARRRRAGQADRRAAARVRRLAGCRSTRSCCSTPSRSQPVLERLRPGVLALQDPRAAGRRRRRRSTMLLGKREPRGAGRAAGRRLAARRSGAAPDAVGRRHDRGRRLRRPDDPVRAAHRSRCRAPPARSGRRRSIGADPGRRRAHRPGALRLRGLRPLSGRHLLAAAQLRQGRRLDRPGPGRPTPFTTFAGLFERATGAPPYRLPGRWTRPTPEARPGHRARLRHHQRHHRRQLRLAGGRRQRPDRRHGVRRQHPLASPATSPTTAR